MKIVKIIRNVEAVKIVFGNRKELMKVWEKRGDLKERHDMLLVRWISMKERRGRYITVEEMQKLREKNRRRGINIEIIMEGGKVSIEGRWRIWNDGKRREAE